MKLLISLMLICWAQVSIGEQAHSWQLSRDEESIRSYKSNQAGQKLVAFKSDSVIDAPIAEVLSVLLDDEDADKWIPRLAGSEIRTGDWPTDYVQFTRFDSPWPVRDRIFLSRVNVTVDPETHLTDIYYHNQPNAELVPKTILGSTEGSHYQLHSLNNGTQTRLIAISMANPNGSIPKWLVNWVCKNVPHDTVVLLREHLANNTIVVEEGILQLYREQTTKTVSAQ